MTIPNYVIFCPYRTGSTWLCRMLRDNDAGRPSEYYNPTHKKVFSAFEKRAREESLDHAREMNHERVLDKQGKHPRAIGSKVIVDHLAHYNRMHYSPATHIITLQRHDLIGQTISWWRAQRSGIWGHGGPHPPKDQYKKKQKFIPAIAHHELDALYDQAQAFDHMIDTIAHGRPRAVLSIAYETMMEAPRDCVAHVLDHLGLPHGRIIMEPEVDRIQRDKWTEEVRAGWLAHRETL